MFRPAAAQRPTVSHVVDLQREIPQAGSSSGVSVRRIRQSRRFVVLPQLHDGIAVGEPANHGFPDSEIAQVLETNDILVKALPRRDPRP
jgi:hypothetical protein